ncbi:MAG: hypothetical protein Q6L68_12900, partial [Thermostichus sp. DG02_5_bins_236]
GSVPAKTLPKSASEGSHLHCWTGLSCLYYQFVLEIQLRILPQGTQPFCKTFRSLAFLLGSLALLMGSLSPDPLAHLQSV